MCTLSCLFIQLRRVMACVVLLGVALLCATGQGPAQAASAPKPERPLFGLALGSGSLEDNSFNQMQLSGMRLARPKFGVDYLVEKPASMADNERALRYLIEQGATVIICGGGWHMKGPADTLAREFPHVFFIILDDTAVEYLPNVASVTFRQNEGSYLVGALSAIVSKSDHVCFIGASDFNVINDFQVGFEAGVQRIAPQARLDVAYIDAHPEAEGKIPFDLPEVAEAMAEQMYADGCEVIYAVAAGSNRGVFNAAVRAGAFAVGVDSDQDSMAPGFVLTSMMKRLDKAILFIVEKALDGTLANEAYSLGLKEGGVALSPMTYTAPLVDDVEMRRVRYLRHLIERGELDVPSAIAVPNGG